MTTSVPTSFKVKVRGICFTLNNYTLNDESNLMAFAKTQCLYLVFGREICPTTGTPHLQGFLYFENPRVYPNMNVRVETRNAHDEIMKGTPRQAADYCKKDGDFWEFGDVPTQGARADWEKALTDLKTNTMFSVLETQPHLIPCVRALERVKQLSLQPISRNVTVTLFLGPPGVGKSRAAYSIDPDLYTKPDGLWFDGYLGQKTLLLDDYDGDIRYTTLLKVLDRYPLQVPIKGGFVWAQWDQVIITSNRHFSTWYPENITGALNRRISVVDMEHNHAPQEDVQEAHVPQA
nr:MAG: replication associated protein [Arizlama virus]